MFKNINSLIWNLLETLSYTYKSNNINYNVYTHECSIFRLLAPIEILNLKIDKYKDKTKYKDKEKDREREREF